MQSKGANMGGIVSPRSTGITIARMTVMLLVAFGYISTMARGPGTEEYGRIFGLDPSWHGMNVLFIMAGFFALKSLARHGSAWQLLKRRARNNLIPITIFALIVVTIIYPLLGNPSGSLTDTVFRLSQYALGLVTCVDPGAILPGLLDEAKYMCSIQGAIWTLRWGAVAYVGAAIAWQSGIFKHESYVVIAALITLVIYILGMQNHVSGWVQMPEFIQAPLRLGAMFLLGAGAFTYNRLSGYPSNKSSLFIGLFLLSLTAFQFYVLPWTPFIEVTAAIGLAVLTAAFAQFIDATRLRSWPIHDLSLWIFLIHWPAAQIILLALPELTSWTLIILTLPVTIGLSILVKIALDNTISTRSSQPYKARA